MECMVFFLAVQSNHVLCPCVWRSSRSYTMGLLHTVVKPANKSSVTFTKMSSQFVRRLDAPLVWVHPGGDPTPFTSLGPYQSRILANMNLVANEIHFVCTKKGWYFGYIHVLLDKLEVHLWTAFIYCHVSVHALLELCNRTVRHCGT